MFDGKQEECINEIITAFIESVAFKNLLLENLSIESQHSYGSYGETGYTEVKLKWDDTTISSFYIDDCKHTGD
jgi:hypothetical protein